MNVASVNGRAGSIAANTDTTIAGGLGFVSDGLLRLIRHIVSPVLETYFFGGVWSPVLMLAPGASPPMATARSPEAVTVRLSVRVWVRI